MNFVRFFLILSCLFSQVAFSSGGNVQFRVGNFFPTSDFMRKVYKNGGLEFEVEGNIMFPDDYSLWLNFNSFGKNGHSLELDDTNKAKVRLYPLSFGIKGFVSLMDPLSLYLGVGGSCSFVRINDEPLFSKQSINKNAWGFVGKSGFIVNVTDHIFLDLFADYYYTKMRLDNCSNDIGGVRAGVGFGIDF